MRQKGRIESQLHHEPPGRYENTSGPPAWAAENRPERAGQDRLGNVLNNHQLVSTAGNGYTSSYLGQNINVRPYAIALYPFCAQVKPLMLWCRHFVSSIIFDFYKKHIIFAFSWNFWTFSWKLTAVDFSLSWQKKANNMWNNETNFVKIF